MSISICLQIAADVYNVIKSGRTCLALGGDHSMAIGSIYGHSLAEPEHVVVWVDAHADINPNTPDVILWEHAWDAFVIPCERATTIYQQTTRIRFHQAMVILFSICLEVYMGPLHMYVLQLKTLVCGKYRGLLSVCSEEL